MAMVDNTNVLNMLAANDKLDGTNYPLWSYMMCHVLVAKGLWSIVHGEDECLIVVANTSRVGTSSVDDIGSIEDATGSIFIVAPILAPWPNAEKLCWDGRDAQAHALIALSIKCTIVPHIRSAKIAKQAWDIPAYLYAGRNEAHVAYLRKQLESKHMEEGDSIDIFLIEIKDLKE